MAKFCTKCGKEKQNCICTKHSLNYPKIITFIITFVVVGVIIYFIAGLFMVKSTGKNVNNNASSVEKIENNAEKNDENLKNDNNDLQEIQKEESLTNEIMPDNIVTCTLVQDHRTFKNIFYFNDGVIYKYRIEHVFPDDVNIDEYYNDEVDMNAGTYNISRNGQTIIYDLDNTMYYWEYFNYKDEPYRRIYKIFTEDGWSCEG